MSIHKSLFTAGKLRWHRNVLTRAERLEILKKEDRWKEGQSVFGIPKVRSIMMKAKKKAKEKEEAAVPAEAAAAGTAPVAVDAVNKGGAVPAAAGAKGATPKKEKK